MSCETGFVPLVVFLQGGPSLTWLGPFFSGSGITSRVLSSTGKWGFSLGGFDISGRAKAPDSLPFLACAGYLVVGRKRPNYSRGSRS
jgi:hypothetical protein